MEAVVIASGQADARPAQAVEAQDTVHGQVCPADGGASHHLADAAAGASGRSCPCHESDVSSLPELDARAIPHAIRHAAIFGALDGLAPGSALVLVAPHDPLPLLAQLQRRAPGAFAIDYLERGPGSWRLRMVRTDQTTTDD